MRNPNLPIFPFVCTFNFNNNRIFPTMKNTIENLQRSKTIEDVSKDSKLIKGWRQPPNQNNYNKPYFYCECILEGLRIKFKMKQNLSSLNSNSTAKTRALFIQFYFEAVKRYIGQTDRSLKERFSIYKQHANHPQYPIIKKSTNMKLQIRKV